MADLIQSVPSVSTPRIHGVDCGMAVWFTGLSGAGKTTLCNLLAPELRALGYPVEVLDGDVIRRNAAVCLGFKREDRDENIARIAAMAQSLVEQQVIVLVAAISPYREARERARLQIRRFLEVYVNAPLGCCIARDPKGLYARALQGQIQNLRGSTIRMRLPSLHRWSAGRTPKAAMRVRRESWARSWRRNSSTHNAGRSAEARGSHLRDGAEQMMGHPASS